MTHSPSAPVKLSAPPRHRAPLTGIIAGVLLVGGLGLWTFQRVGEAKTVQSDVEVRRAADSERTAALAREPQRVQVVRGTPERWVPQVDLDGTLEAQHQAPLAFKVGGRLSRVNVKVGDRVRAGTVLGQLDLLETTAQANASEAQVRAADASLAIAEDAERRTLPLVQNGSIAAESGVQATSQRELARAQLDSARAQLALARAGVDNHTLSAPFSGTITRAPTGIGAVVTPGQTQFELVDTSTLKLSTTVSEGDANLLVEGAKVEIVTDTGSVLGHVTAILSTLDARTRRVPVVVEFGNQTKPSPAKTNAASPDRASLEAVQNDAMKNGAASALRAGAFVRARVAADREIPVLRVPHTVLRPGARDEVLALSPGSDRLELRHIVYSIAPDGTLLVRRGIDARDELVLAPIAEAKAGDVVRVERPAAEASAPLTAAPSAQVPAAVAPKAGTP
jgi:RND family efflux transporter MFP subunit